MISNTKLDDIAVTKQKTSIDKVFDTFRLIKGILYLQLKQLKTGLLIITAFFVVYILFFSILYPGDEGLKGLITILQDPQYQIFIGTFPQTNFYYSMWLQLVIVSYIPALMVASGLYLGVEVITREEADKTYDIGFSIPHSRSTIISIRLFGAILCILLLTIIGISFTYIGAIFVSQNFDFVVIVQLWSIMGIQALFGLALGFITGSLLFDRGLAFQLMFGYLISSFILYMVLNSASALNINKDITNILEAVCIFSYFKAKDILYFNIFNLDAVYPVIFLSLVFFIIGIVVFSKRNLMITEFKPIYVYLNPFYWLKRNRTRKISKTIKTSQISLSRILVLWSQRFKKRFPIFADDLWANGLFLLIYSLLIFLGVIMHVIIYPGDVDAVPFIESLSQSPIFSIFIRDYDIVTNPFLGYLTLTVFSRLILYLLPYVVYRFFQIELRDEGKTNELIWSAPISQQQIYLQRFAAVLVEFYIVLIFTCIGYIIPEIIFGKTQNTLMEILIIFLMGPLCFIIGVIISLFITYIPKYGKYIAMILVLFSLLFYFGGILNKDMIWLSQLTPYYYFDPVVMLFEGIQLSSVITFLSLVIILAILVIIRIQKKTHYILQG